MRGAAALILGGFIAACSHDDIDYTPLVDGKVQAYQETFVEAYGAIDPNQTWGFTLNNVNAGNVEVPAAARMTRGHNANANMWAKDGYSVPAPLTAAQKDKVRRWFQQHKNPHGEAINYTTFFVQDVYKGGTNTTGSLSTEEYTAANGDTFIGSDQMDWLTAGSNNDHINNYNNGQCSTNSTVWDGVTYQEGWPKEDQSQAENWNHIVYHSDEIMLMVDSKTDCFGFTNSRQGKQQYNDQYVIIPGDLIQLWDKSTTVNGESSDVSGMWFVGFDYEADLDHRWGSTVDSNGYLATEVEEGTEGAFQVPNEGPYKGKWVIDGAADGYYSDWIVRITPGILGGEITIPIDQGEETEDKITVKTTTYHYQTTQLIEQGRVFCEDLGKISRNDLDFNDVVFDAYVTKIQPFDVIMKTEDDVPQPNDTIWGTATYKTEIVLLAAGGTLPLTLAGSYDVHDVLGHNPYTTIINTIADKKNGTYGNVTADPNPDPVQLGTNFNYSSIVEIPIKVQYSDGSTLELKAEQGWAPHKILVPIGTKWCRERENIADAYPKFKEYVNNVGDQPKFWDASKDKTRLFYHPKDTYQPRSQTPVTIETSPAVGPITTYRSKSGTTINTGGYDGEPVLSRRNLKFND